MAIGIKQYQTTILNGTALSAAISLGADVLHGIQMPAGWDAASMSFQASIDGGLTFAEMIAAAGTAVSCTVAGGQYIALDPTLWRAVNCLKIRSGTSASPVNQTADRLLTLVVKPVA